MEVPIAHVPYNRGWKWTSPRKIRKCSHFTGETWKHSFISTVRPIVHTNPLRKRIFSIRIFTLEEFAENADFEF